MRPRALSAMVAGAAALALAATFAAPANAGSGPTVSHRGVAGPAAAASPGAVCFSSAAADVGNAVTSQNFARADNAFDTHTAGDFKCPGATGAFKIKKVSVIGQYFNGAGPADSVNVTIYNQTGGEPGSVKCSYKNLPYTNGPSFVIALPSACQVANGKAFWVEVQANMDFATGGQWGWELGTPADLKQADFKNPNDGFGTGCTQYQNDLYMIDCIPSLTGDEVIFTISGSAV